MVQGKFESKAIAYCFKKKALTKREKIEQLLFARLVQEIENATLFMLCSSGEIDGIFEFLQKSCT